MHAHMCTTCVLAAFGGQQRVPFPGVTDSCELSYGDLFSLQRQQVLIITEPSSQPPIVHLRRL